MPDLSPTPGRHPAPVTSPAAWGPPPAPAVAGHPTAPTGAPKPTGILGGVWASLTRPVPAAEAHRHPEPDVRAVCVAALNGAALLTSLAALAALSWSY